MCVFPLGKFTYFIQQKLPSWRKANLRLDREQFFPGVTLQIAKEETHTHTHIKAPRDHSVGFFTYFVPASCMYETWCVVLMKTCKESPHPFKTTSWKCIGVCCHKPPDRCCRSKKKKHRGCQRACSNSSVQPKKNCCWKREGRSGPGMVEVFIVVFWFEVCFFGRLVYFGGIYSLYYWLMSFDIIV